MSDERVERRLAAILAADVAGYSRLMGANEEGTLAQLKSIRKALIDPTIAEHRGRIVKTTGDGMLVEFASAVDAVRGAIEIQRGMAEQNAFVPQDQRIEFRIGIHVGDIIIDDNDIFGDGVNIAARLEGIAEPGGVCVSDDTYRQIRDRVDAAFDDKGETALKNIARPVRVFALAGAKQPAIKLVEPTLPLVLPDKPSIAVLPFQNMSGDPEQEYFADGMVEDIITGLSRFKSLFVIARNSSFTYKGKAVDIKQVGRELGVRYVLEGSVRKAGGKVRITGQLIDAMTGRHIWADKFDGIWGTRSDEEVSDIFELQDGLVTRVIGAIAPRLEQAEIERAKQKSTDNLDAYDLYLRGLASWNRWTKIEHAEAMRLFYASIDHDPEFSTPYGLALSCYIMSQANGWSTDFDKTEIARLVRRATDIGMDDPIALCWAGHALIAFFGDFDQGLSLASRATELDGNLAIAWVRRGWICAFAGESDAAIDSLNRAIRLNPLEPRIFLTCSCMALAHFVGRRPEEAVAWALKALRVKPDWPPALRIAAASYGVLGVQSEAANAVTRYINAVPGSRLSSADNFRFFKKQNDREYFVCGLRAAGFPE